jgi:hypothetical protein
MKGILADVNCEGHLRLLLHLFQDESRCEFWDHLKLTTPSFADLGLAEDATDATVWERCQQEQLVLLTINRNADGPDSLEVALRTLSTTDSLPVVTVADARRLMQDRVYAEKAADKFLVYLFEMDKHLGTGRLYVP